MIKFSFFLLCLSIQLCLQGQPARVFEQLRESGKANRSFYLYPSTLRMINLEDIEEFNEMIKDLKKVIFLRMEPEQFGKADLITLKSEFMAENRFEEYLIIENTDRQVYILGRDKPVETVILTNIDEGCYLATIEGSLDLLQLPRFLQILSENDREFKTYFSNLYQQQNPDEQEQVDTLQTIDTLKN